jgi:hypothetical protein
LEEKRAMKQMRGLKWSKSFAVQDDLQEGNALPQMLDYKVSK